MNGGLHDCPALTISTPWRARGFDPMKFMSAGDVVEWETAGLGARRNTVR